MLTKYVSIYVPSTRHAVPITAEEHKSAVSHVAGEFSKVLGGATAYPASGYWQSDTAGLIEESVTIVRSYYTPELVAQAQALAHSLAEGIKVQFGQEAVTIETEEGIEFI